MKNNQHSDNQPSIRKPTNIKYSANKHINLLITILKEGGSIATFCAQALIDKSTFSEWRKTHPEFKQAYDVYVNAAETIWEKYPLNNEINYQTWYLIMKNRFGWCKPRITDVKNKTAKARIEIIWEAIEQGELAPDEISKLTQLIQAQAAIELKTLTDNITDTIQETRISYEDKIARIQQAVEQARQLTGAN